MASIQLSKSVIDDESLPNVCMRCGDEADLVRKGTFYWQPMEANVSQVLAIVFLWPVGWFAAVMLVEFMCMRPIKITDRSITLTNVSEEFVDEMERRD